jgi:sterol desaturase/sphingolipid hydroxylase (fatty acid hydroxylase superfamily)
MAHGDRRISDVRKILADNPRLRGDIVERMSPETLRLTGFLVGLFTLLSWELAAPHHSPTVPRPRRWLANLTFAATNGIVVSLVCLACYLLAERQSAPWRFGPFQQLAMPFWLRLPGEVLVLDLLVYFLHRAYHRYPLLWRFHLVHHSDRDLDVTSASRFHLGEVTISGVSKFGAVQLLGISPTGLIGFEIVMLAAAQLQHANIRLPRAVEPRLWLAFVPPAMHRVHHHPLRAATDSNFGTLVSFWDRLFGTLRHAAPSDREFGVPTLPDERALGPVRLFLLPFRRA